MSQTIKNIFNYIGQLRIYSLVDLVLLGYALHTNTSEFVGIIFLHIGFLAYLEARHSHSYRKKIPEWVWIVLVFLGILFFRHWSVIGYLLASHLYTRKSHGYFAAFSPLARVLQYFFLAAGVIGFANIFVWIIFAAIFIRNLAGDLRDAGKDHSEGMKTIPVLLGARRNVKYVHLGALFFTTLLWWAFSGLSPWYLLLVIVIEIGTYNLTPR